LGLRLRYDVRREFAPYVGVNFEWLLGQTADFARAAGADDEEASFVMGLRAWF
jgi:copper resistance protein B